MALTVLHKRNDTIGVEPLVTDLAIGEFSVNTHDGEVFFAALVDPAGGTGVDNQFVFSVRRPSKADGGEIIAP